MKYLFPLICAALVMGAAYSSPPPAWAGSCCGGGAATALVLPKGAQAMIDTSFDYEQYDGAWAMDDTYLHQEQGTDQRQYRLNLGYALRLAPRWQTSVAVPYVWNINDSRTRSSRSSGLGDTMFSLWYEAFDSPMCRVGGDLSLEDLVPAATFGLSLTFPTGISPYDDAESSYDITGRGFYRLDANMLLDKTIFPWSASLFLSYGTHKERPVNREYGRYVEPYRKKLGDRAAGTLAISYVQYIDLAETRKIVTYTVSASEVWEGKGTAYGDRDQDSGLKKTTVAGTLAFSTLDRVWTLKTTWNHSLMEYGWGRNTPASDIYSLGVTYVFK